MMQMIKKATISLCVVATFAGCATVPAPGSADDGQVEIEASSHRKNTLLTIGGILLLGAIIANEGADGARDAARDAARP